MDINTLYNQPAFNGLTKIYAISDSHQETRKTSAFLSKILKNSIDKKNVLFLNSGDLFKGIYPRELERDIYVKMKESNPDIEMVMTLGNNDFGFNKESLDYLVDTIKLFTQKGIKVVCANIFNTSGTRPEWLKPYTTVLRDGDKTFITGFCVDNINTARFGIVPKKHNEVMEEIVNAIREEKPDNVVVLNHDYMPISQNIHKNYAQKGINVDVTIGGHDHEIVPPDNELKIYYPEAFGKTMYEVDLNIDKGVKDITSSVSQNENLEINPVFLQELEKFENDSKLYENVAPCILHLPKLYSYSCALGSFLADEMKRAANTDIAFFSTGFLMKPIEYEPNSYITRYKLKKAMIAENPLKKVELSSAELRDVFSHAMKGYGYGESNPKFLQCSNNIKLEGKNNSERGIWELKQVYINDEPLLNEDMSPINPDKKYTCVMDSYIAEGGQGYKTLQDAEKEDVYSNGAQLRISDALLNALKNVPDKYKKGEEYPHFMVNEL